jgi:hypothetical protein
MCRQQWLRDWHPSLLSHSTITQNAVHIVFAGLHMPRPNGLGRRERNRQGNKNIQGVKICLFDTLPHFVSAIFFSDLTVFRVRVSVQGRVLFNFRLL